MISLKQILTCLGGTKWKYPTLSSKFTAYQAGSEPRYRRIGKVVHLEGVIKPTASIALTTTDVELFTLPEGYRPDMQIIQLNQGSGTSFWMLRVKIDGTVTVARARDVGNGSGVYTTAPNSFWMPFNLSYVTDESYPEISSGGGSD